MPVHTLMPANNTAENTDRLPSGAIWNNCPVAWFRENPHEGYLFEPDLMNPDKYASGVSKRGVISLQDTGVLIQGDPTQVGVLTWNGMDADNDAGILAGAGGAGGSFLISDSDARELWYEISIKKESVGNNSIAFFAGLTEEGTAAATDTLLTTDSAALKDLDLIGFHVDQADGDSIDFVYNKASAGGVTVKIAALSAMVADTWIKLGFHYRPLAPTSKRITIFLNGQAQSTYVTGANIAAATFPDGEELIPFIGFKKGEATEADAWMRLWRVAQKR